MTETAIRMCLAGADVAFLLELVAMHPLLPGNLAVVAESPVPFVDQLHVAWRRSVQPSPAMQVILDRLRTAFPAGGAR